MKTLTTLTGAIVAASALAFSATSAKAISTTTDFSVLSFSMTVSKNTGEIYKGGGTYVYQVKSTTFATSDLMHLFESSDFAGTTFPSGSKIVVAWDSPWDGDVVVIDKNNNVLFNASEDNYPDAYFTVDFTEGYGPYNENYLDTDPGHYDYTYQQVTGNFTLYDDLSIYIDLTGTGAGTFNLNQNWNSNGDYSTFSHSASLNATGASSSEYFNDISYTGVKATIKASGSGKGESALY